MKVDASKPICGVRPAVLKNLLRNDSFDTPTAMKCLDLDEPYVTETLTRLERARWISFTGTHDGVDTWKIESRGMRLTATRLMKRIGAAEGRTILARLIEEVRTVNADESLSRRVRSVLLFGSLISAGEGDTIGDIDVVVYVERRAVNEGVLDALEKQEVAAKDPDMDYVKSLYWPETRLRQRLAKVSRYLSFHRESDISATGARYQEVYAYDVAQEREVTANTQLRVMKRVKEPHFLRRKRVERESRGVRRWPAAPKRAIAVDMDGEDGPLAQHLWMNNVGLPQIAKRLRLKPAVVQAYLSARASRGARSGPKTFGCLKSTLIALLPKKRTYWVSARLVWQQTQSVFFDIHVFDDRGFVANLRRVGGKCRILRSRADLVGVLEDADRAVSAWFAAARSRMRGLGAEVVVICAAGDKVPRSADRKFVDLQPLRQPMLDLLDQLWVKPRGKYDGYYKRLVLSLAEDPTATFHQHQGDSEGKRIKAPVAAGVLEAARTLHTRFSNALKLGAWSVSVDGNLLASELDE